MAELIGHLALILAAASAGLFLVGFLAAIAYASFSTFHNSQDEEEEQ